MKSRARKLALAAVAVVALFVLAAVVLAASLFPTARLTPLVRDGLSKVLVAPVGLRAAHLVLFPWPQVALEDLVIGDPTGYARPKAWPRGGVAAAKRARATVELSPLFAHRIEIREVVLEDARVTLVRNEQGVGNWEGLGGKHARARAGGPAFDVALRKLELTGARAQYFDARDGAWFDVRRLDQVLSLRTTGGGTDQRIRTVARVQRVGGRTPWPLGARPITLEADVESQGSGATWLVRKIGLTRGALALSGHGTVTGPERTLAFMLDQASLPLGALLELLPADENARLGDLSGSGTVRLGLAANGPLSDHRMPAVRARVQIDKGRLVFKNRALAIEDLACDVLATEHGSEFKRIAGRVGRSVFEASGMSSGWADPRVKLRLRANADLADIMRFLPLADSTRLAGNFKADLEGAGRPAGGTGAFGWSGRIDLAGVSATGLGLGYPVRDVNGAIGLAPGRAWATGLTAQLGRSDVTLDGTVEQPFEFFAALTNAGRRAPPEAVARFSLKSRRIDGDELFSLQRSNAPLPRVHAEGSFAIGALKYQRFSGTNAVGRLVYADGVTNVPELAVDAYEGRMRGAAWFDVADRAHPVYKVHAHADRVDANSLLKAWTPVKDVAFGTLEMSLLFDGTGLEPQQIARSLSGHGLAQVLGGKLAGAEVFAQLARFTGVDRFKLLSFRDLSAPFRVENGRVAFDPLVMTTGGTDWFAKGSVGLDGTLDFHIAALVPQAELSTLPAGLTRVAGALLGKDGKLSLDMLLRGTVQKPQFAWDSERTASRLLERGEQQMEDLARQFGGSLADSLLGSKTTEDRAAGMLADQQRRLEEEAQKRTDEMTKKALSDLEALFRKKAPPPPPPPDTSVTAGTPGTPGTPSTPPDTASAPDTSARDSTAVPSP